MKAKQVFMVVLLAMTVGLVGLQQANAGVDEQDSSSSPRHFQKLDDATKAKIEKFRDDTKDLRKQMAVKRAEQIALIKRDSPDVEAVRKTSGELFDLKMAMMEKAKTAELFMFAKGDDKDGSNTEKRAKIGKFFTDTKELRRQIFVKRAEQQSLMHSKTLDTEALAKISGEVFDLKTTLQEKAKEAGLPRHSHRKGWGRHHQGWQFS